MTKRATGAGNMFQIVMELQGLPAEGEVRDWLDACSRKLPLLAGRTRRDFNLAPYWHMPSHPRQVSLDVRRLRADEEIPPLLERGVNTAFRSEHEHLAFQMIRTGESGHVAAKFDHRLFDAHGAEIFLGMLQQDWEEGGRYDWELPPPEPARLEEWREKFEAGKRMNRTFLRLAENGPPRALRSGLASAWQGFAFRNLTFTEQQSREIIERAENEAGYLMAMPYTLALTVQAFHALFASRGLHTGDYVIPVTMDTRVPGGRPDAVFFNNVSILLFRIPGGEVDDFHALLDTVKKQMYEQARMGLARDLLEASLLMRIVPLSMVSHLVKLYLKKDIASFCFSFLGDTGHMPTRFMGEKVSRSYHMARVPVPPGLGVFLHQTHGRLSVHLSYLRGVLAEGEVERVMQSLHSKLGG
jgi:hypothetical protein